MYRIIKLFLAIALLATPVLADTFGEWTYSVENGEATISYYRGSGGAVVIPSELNGLPVKKIGEWGLPVFGATVDSITIPSSVTSIGDNAFFNCFRLSDLTIPTSVTNIGSMAFNGNRSLISVTIPSSVKNIGRLAFNNCISLMSFNVNLNNTNYSSLDGVLYNREKTILIRCPAAKSGTLTIPNSVTIIEESAFVGCTNLTSITIPNSVTNIGNNAFNNCTNLTSITIPSSVTSIGDNAFSSCTSLTSVILATGVVNIGKFAFAHCDLTSVAIPNSVTSIGGGAFANLYKLTSISIPESVANIGFNPFEYCISLTNILVNLNNTNYSSLDGVLYDREKTILIACPAAKSGTLTIPNSVTIIGERALKSCRNLTSITIPNSVTSIGDEGFSLCSSLTNITIPNSVTNIGNNAFNNCTNLISIYIPNNVINIGFGAFHYCTRLTNIVIPNKVTSIGGYTFSGTGLNKITIPNGVTSIGASAFSNCTNLTSITIPNSVTSIGGYAFSGCTSLTNIFLLGTHPLGWSSINELLFMPTNLVIPKISSFRFENTNNSLRQELRFKSFPELSYSIEKSTDLVNWANKTNMIGDGSEMTFSEETTNSRAFYRLIQF